MTASERVFSDQFKTLRCVLAHGVLTVWLAEQRMSYQMLCDLHTLAGDIPLQSDIQVVVLASKHPDFCHGIDLRDTALAMAIAQDGGRSISVLGGELVHRWSHLPMPTVCRVRGRAVGAGACLTWACDFRVATPDSTVWFPEIDRGMHLAWGSSHVW